MRCVWAIMCLGVFWLSVANAADRPDTESSAPAVVLSAGDERFEKQLRPMLRRYCIDCHAGEKPKGNLRLDRLQPDFADDASRSRRSRVLRRIAAGEMPPAGKPQPSKDEVKAITSWLAPRLRAADAAAQAKAGRVVLRRLNRVEYENTIRDLLGIPIRLKKQLPEDGSADGFDNSGAAHHTSVFLMEKYLEAADAALNMAIANRPGPPKTIKQRYSIKDGHPIRSTREDVYRFLKDGEVVCFCSSEWHNVWLSHFYPRDGGLYRFRISASGFQSRGKPVTFQLFQPLP